MIFWGTPLQASDAYVCAERLTNWIKLYEYHHHHTHNKEQDLNPDPSGQSDQHFEQWPELSGQRQSTNSIAVVIWKKRILKGDIPAENINIMKHLQMHSSDPPSKRKLNTKQGENKLLHCLLQRCCHGFCHGYRWKVAKRDKSCNICIEKFLFDLFWQEKLGWDMMKALLCLTPEKTLVAPSFNAVF